MIALSVNLNKIALLRNSRGANFPDVLFHARLALEAGADGITVHPRPDRRHIHPEDVFSLKQCISHYPAAEFNIEGNPFSQEGPNYPSFIKLIEQAAPHQCTLVPDNENQLTSDHGFDLQHASSKLKPVIQHLKSIGVRVSLFMAPDLEQISRAAECGAQRIELYTGPFAEAFASRDIRSDPNRIFDAHCAAAEHAQTLGLGINAGHDLNQLNLQQYRLLPHLKEVSIGHALIADALLSGFSQTVRAYKALLTS